MGVARPVRALMLVLLYVQVLVDKSSWYASFLYSSFSIMILTILEFVSFQFWKLKSPPMIDIAVGYVTLVPEGCTFS